ncbi:unnamed protein product [Brassicogethes aeneus]|uniref:Uncharacterized protein n=1 Tax=Brassicogethes aeneus TaxID=1431903 RepID=A0A9P0AWQ0_BRAAE|nr:unnamed protein product [Brassicogethes aeneus]
MEEESIIEIIDHDSDSQSSTFALESKLQKTTEKGNKVEVIQILTQNPNLLDAKIFRIYKSILHYYYQKNDREMVEEIIRIGYEKSRDPFYAVASCEASPSLNKNETKEGDTPLMFLLKYGQYNHKDFMQHLNMLLTEINMNKMDYYHKTPLMIAQQKNATDVVELLKKKNVLVDVLTELFNLIIQKKSTEFGELLSHNMHLKNCDDGENTLLQLSIIYCPNITTFLLSIDVDVNRTTERSNKFPPILLAALFDEEQIFHALVNNKTLKISQDLFCSFLIYRSNKVKPKYVKTLLECDNLDVNYTTKQDNTPLHYAIIFHHTDATKSLLKRGASLTKKNKNGKTCLSMINPSVLHEYLDSCIVFDNFNNDIRCARYKIVFNFQNIVDRNDEIDLVRKMGSKNSLRNIFNHPLVEILIHMKWHLAKPLFIASVILRFIYYLLITILLVSKIHYPIFIGMIVLGQAIITYNFLYIKDYKKNNVHGFFEALLLLNLLSQLIILLINFEIKSLEPFAYVIMSIIFTLHIGYHPNLSKWAAMLQMVCKTFFKLFCLFFIPILAFTLGFYQLFYKNKPFKNIQVSLFTVLVMLTGEFDANDNFVNDSVDFFDQVFFISFLILMTVILMNFWTAVTVSDISKLEKDSATVAAKHTLGFLQFAEKVYRTSLYRFIEKTLCLKAPFLSANCLSEKRSKNCKKFIQNNKKETICKVECHINRQKMFTNNLDTFKLNSHLVCRVFEFYEHRKKNKLALKNEQELRNEIRTINHILERLEARVAALTPLTRNHSVP